MDLPYLTAITKSSFSNSNLSSPTIRRMKKIICLRWNWRRHNFNIATILVERRIQTQIFLNILEQIREINRQGTIIIIQTQRWIWNRQVRKSLSIILLQLQEDNCLQSISRLFQNILRDNQSLQRIAKILKDKAIMRIKMNNNNNNNRGINNRIMKITLEQLLISQLINQIYLIISLLNSNQF